MFGPDGAMYVSDDQAGVIYRVTYQRESVVFVGTGLRPVHAELQLGSFGSTTKIGPAGRDRS